MSDAQFDNYKVWFRDELENHRRLLKNDVNASYESMQMFVKAQIDRLTMLEPKAFEKRETSCARVGFSDTLTKMESSLSRVTQADTTITRSIAPSTTPSSVVVAPTNLSLQVQGDLSDSSLNPEESRINEFSKLRQSLQASASTVAGTGIAEDDECARARSALQKNVAAQQIEDLFGHRSISENGLDVLAAWIIFLNCLLIAVQAEHVGYASEKELGRRVNDDIWPNADGWFQFLEHCFNGFFIFELLVRFVVMGYKYFRDAFNVFDLAVVALSSCQLYFLEPLEMTNTGASLTMFRLIRLVRVLRLFRVVRTVETFATLRILIKTCASSFRALIWSMVLLFAAMLIGGLCMAELTKDFIRDSNNDIKWRNWVFKHYGSGTRAVYTLFEVTLAGCWPTYFRPLIEHVSVWYVIPCTGYISVVVFALIRICTAIFLKETMENAVADADMIINDRVKKKQEYIRKLEKVFATVDTDGSGEVSLPEFKLVCAHPKVKTWLQHLELEIHDAEALFRLLDDGDGKMTYDEFLKGVLRLKGNARSVDVVAILRQGDNVLRKSKVIEAQMGRLVDLQLKQEKLMELQMMGLHDLAASNKLCLL